MDLKRKSTLSRALSRFSRKPAAQPDVTSTVTPAQAPAQAPAPIAEPTVAPTKHVSIDTKPTEIVAPTYNTVAPESHVDSVNGYANVNDNNNANVNVNDSSNANVNNNANINNANANYANANNANVNNNANANNTNANRISFSADTQPPRQANASYPTSTNPSHMGASRNGTNIVSPPTSPRVSSTHTRDGTGMSSASNASRQGLSGSEEENSEGGFNPADILLHRMTAYRTVLKNLQQYFAEIASVENGIAKSMHKASNIIVVPFKDGNQFLGKGGLQDVCTGVRNSTKIRSDQHANTAIFVEETIVKNIRRLKRDIKAKIKAFKSDASLYETRVFKEREVTQELMGNLARAIGLFENSGGHQPDMEKSQSDPYLINLALKRQLVRQVNEENIFARAFQQYQEQIMMFEKYIINEIKQVLNSFAQYQHANSNAGFGLSWASTEAALNALQEDSEWNNFLERNGHLLFPSELVDSNPEELSYPCKDSRYVTPIKTANLSRQSSVLKHWKEGFFVLTLSGWLHVFASTDLLNDPVPERSIYIPTANLGPHTDQTQNQHVFSLEGKGMGGILHRDAQIFTLRANSREEMLDWWEELSKRAHSSMFVQPGDGSLSRSGSVRRSSSLLRSGSRATRPQTPASPKSAHAPVYSSHGEFNTLGEKPGPIDVAPETQTVAPGAQTVAPGAQTIAPGAQTVVPVANAATTNYVNGPAYGATSDGTAQAVKPVQNVASQPVPLNRIDTGSTTSTSDLPIL
ncbi:hypothetical protein BGZ49_008591 [Haplosporangium sp. Z 27]|nr:hypothetical protein BGZ49_008591 [Haplosporangium sp. Z 27]